MLKTFTNDLPQHSRKLVVVNVNVSDFPQLETYFSCSLGSHAVPVWPWLVETSQADSLLTWLCLISSFEVSYELRNNVDVPQEVWTAGWKRECECAGNVFKINQALNSYEKLWKLYVLRVKQIHPFIRYSGRAVARISGLYFNQMWVGDKAWWTVNTLHPNNTYKFKPRQCSFFSHIY